MLIELAEGFYVNPQMVAVVKRTGEGECALFTNGQSATDGGFTLPYDAKEVVEQVNDALAADDEGEEGEDE